MLTALVPRSTGGIRFRPPRLSIQTPPEQPSVLVAAFLCLCLAGPVDAQSAEEPEAGAAVATVSDDGEEDGSAGSAAAPTQTEKPVHSDVRASSFQEITPGKTTLKEVKEAMGEPLAEQLHGAETTLHYALGPFPKVEIIILDEVVDSVVVHLDESARPSDIATELGLDEFSPASIYGEAGELLGEVYPERGVAFSFVSGKSPPGVLQLVLSPITAEFFVLRAQDEMDTHYERRLADANTALDLAPETIDAHLCRARVLMAAGHFQGALSACENALRLDPQHVESRFTRSQVMRRLGDYEQALQETEALLAEQDLPPLLRAQATAHLGDLRTGDPWRDFETATDHHLKAVELAAPLASSKQRRVRQQARRLLVEVHLAIANDITRGKWTRKEEAAPKWLRTARTLAEKTLEDDATDEVLRLLLLEGALSCYVGMTGAVDPTDVVQELLLVGKELAEAAPDNYRRRAIEWLLVDALSDAVRIEQMRGNTESIGVYAQGAIELLGGLAASEETSLRINDRVGLLHFFVGSTYAVRAGEHAQAVLWYEKALPYLSKTQPPADSRELGRHGQRFVSMGVSYWETGARDEGIRLTEEGMAMMLTAAKAGRLEETALAVPYANLAAMYGVVGREAEAKQLASKAATLEGRR